MLLKLIACPGWDDLQRAHAIASDGSGDEVPTRGRFRVADSAGGPARKCLLSEVHGCFSGVPSGRRRGEARPDKNITTLQAAGQADPVLATCPP